MREAALANVRRWASHPDRAKDIAAAIEELHAASVKFPPFNSPHEGFAVLYEEVDELWQEVRDKGVTKAKLRAEAKQVAAMAMRFLLDLHLWDHIPEGPAEGAEHHASDCAIHRGPAYPPGPCDCKGIVGAP